MSRLKPDFDLDQINKDFYTYRKNSAIQAEIVEPEPPVTLEVLKENIRKFVLNFTPDDQKKYQLANLTAKTCTHNRELTHHWELIKMFFIQALKESSESKDLTKIIEALESVDLSQFKQKNFDNTVFLVYLLGILNGLL